MIKNLILVLIAVIITTFDCALAQQTIFNVPSADVTPKGHIYLEQESQLRPWNNGAYWLGTQYGAYGVGHNTEVDVNVFNVGAPATNSVTMGVGFKSCMPIAGLKEKYPEREYKFTVGSQVTPSLQGQGTGNWTYSHLSGRVPVTKTRLTAGVSYGTRQVFGSNNVSFIGGVEQPVTKRVTLLSDWFSGNEHYSGFLISGFSYNFPKKNTTLFVGYQVPNSSQAGVSGFVLEVAKLF